MKTFTFFAKNSQDSELFISILRTRIVYCKVCPRWIPHILMPRQKRHRVAYSTALLKMNENFDPRHFDELVTGDETLLYYSEPLRKAMNKAWVLKDGYVPQTARRCCSKKKVLLHNIFFTQRAFATETTQGRREHHGRELHRLRSSRTEH